MAQKTSADDWVKVWESDKLRGDASFEDYFTSISRHPTATANAAYDLWVTDQHNINYSFAGYLDALVPTAAHLSVLAPVWKADSKTTFCLPDYMIRVVSADGFSNIPSLLPRWWSAAGTWSGDLPSWLQAGAPSQGSRPPKPPESARRERIAPPRAKPQEPSSQTPPPTPPPPTTVASKTYYGGIMYHTSGDNLLTLVYRNYSSSTELVNEMEEDHPDYGYITISSGKCAAVVYGYPLPGFPVSSGMWGSGRGSTEKSATNAALKEVNWWSDNTKVVKTYCQD